MDRQGASLENRIGEFCREQGVDLVGTADMGPARGLVREMAGDLMAEFPRAVALAIRTADTVVDRIAFRDRAKDHLTSTYSYREHAEQATAILRRTQTRLVSMLESDGWQAYSIFGGGNDNVPYAGILSQKIAAHLSGLGWIGKSCLLVSPQFGPRLRLATILTDAPLPVGQPMGDRCGSCHECVDICPVGAIDGRPFRPDEPREARLEASLCSEYCHAELKKLGIKNTSSPGHVCGLCLYVCPHGRRK